MKTRFLPLSTGGDKKRMRMRDYLLKRLSDDEREKLQQLLLTSEDCLDAILEEENDLIDSYARGELPSGLGAQVEKHLLSTPEQKMKLRVARALAEKMSLRDRHQTVRFVSRWLLPAAAVILFTVLGLNNMNLRHRLGAFEKERAVQQGRISREAETKLPPIFLVQLSPDTLRGINDVRKIQIPVNSQFIKMQLELEGREQFGDYSVELSTARGAAVWKQQNLKAIDGIVELWLPAGILKEGGYELSLSEITAGRRAETVGYYHFRVNHP